MRLRRVSATCTGWIVAAALWVAVAEAAPDSRSPAGGNGPGPAASSLAGTAGAGSMPDPLAAGRLADGRVAIFIELADPPAVDVYLANGGRKKGSGPSLDGARANAIAIAASKAAIETLAKRQDGVIGEIKQARIPFDLLFRTQRIANAIAIYTAPFEVPLISELPGVKRVVPLPASQFVSTTSPARFVKAIPFRNTTGLTGNGVDVAVIDTGIDYFHRDFGGPGTGFNANNPAVIGDTLGIFPGPKIAGGYDLAGQDYNGDNIPVPDDDPVDCYGHGTAVAGVLAGFGVAPNGSTFAGPWNFSSGGAPAFSIEPGIAPQARIFAYKIIGCVNNTRLVAAGVDRAIDPNQDGDFSDAPDVINLSVGRSFGGILGNPDIDAVRRASELGIVVVGGAGNEGDTNFILISPASSPYVIAAGGDYGDDTVLDRVTITSPSSQSFVAAIPTQSPRPAPGGTSGQIKLATLNANCSAMSAPTGLAGAIAVFEATSPGGGPSSTAPVCQFSDLTLLAQQAGAVGFIAISFYDAPPQIDDEETPAIVSIPRCLISNSDGQILKGLLALGTVLGKIDGDSPTTHPEYADSVAIFSSRGPGRGGLQTKPDVAAPAVNITGPLVGTASASITNAGTSFATPIVSGEAALLRQLHPDWSRQEIKALIINTANHNQTVAPGAGFAIAPARIGTGRIDLEQARLAKAIAYDPAHPEQVGLSFGAMEVVDTLTTDRMIRVLNKGNTTINYDVGFQAMSSIPGVQTSFPNGFGLSVPPGQTRDILLRLQVADASALRMQRPTGLSATQAGFERYYEPELNGVMHFTPDDGSPVLSVPVIATVRRASRMHTTADLSQVGANGEQSATLHGTGFTAPAPYPEGVGSLVWPMELLYNAPNATPLTPGIKQSAIRAIGVRALDLNGGAIDGLSVYFGIAAQADWETPTEAAFIVYFDADSDGVEDGRFFNSGSSFGRDLLESFMEKPLGASSFSMFYLNDWQPSGLPTYPFNNSVMVMRASAAQLGLTAQKTRFRFRVEALSYDSQATEDQTPWLTYDPLHPGLDFFQKVNYFDTEGNTINWKLNSAKFQADNAQGILMLHGMNVAGERAEILRYRSAVEDWPLYP